MRSLRALSCGVAILLALLSQSVIAQKTKPTPKPTPTPRVPNNTRDEPATPAATPETTTGTSLGAQATAQRITFDNALANLRFREIGPAVMGGRIDDIE